MAAVNTEKRNEKGRVKILLFSVFVVFCFSVVVNERLPVHSGGPRDRIFVCATSENPSVGDDMEDEKQKGASPVHLEDEKQKRASPVNFSSSYSDATGRTSEAPTKLLSAYIGVEAPGDGEFNGVSKKNEGGFVLGVPVINQPLAILRGASTGQPLKELNNYFGLKKVFHQRMSKTEDDKGSRFEKSYSSSEVEESTDGSFVGQMRRNFTSRVSTFSKALPTASSSQPTSAPEIKSYGSEFFSMNQRPKIPFTDSLHMFEGAQGAKNYTSLSKSLAVPIFSSIHPDDATVYFGVGLFVRESSGDDNSMRRFEELNLPNKVAIRQVDFSDRGAAAAKVNSFIAGKTHNKITDVVDPYWFSSDTSSVIASGMYFKGKWEYSFNRNWTREGNFSTFKTTASGSVDSSNIEETNAQFMTTDAISKSDRPIFYHEDMTHKMNVLQLPYKQKGLHMVFIWPSDPKDLYTFTQKTLVQKPGVLDDLINDARQGTKTGYYDLTIPKFKIEAAEATDLIPVLEKAGITSVFTNPRWNSRLPNFEISQFVTKSFIEVDEEGTVAAASAGLVAVNGETVDVVIDRPFLFQIRYSDPIENVENRAEHDNVLFEGQIIDPSELY